METINAVLRFNGYYVKKILFNTDSSALNDKLQIPLAPSFSRSVIKIDDEHYDLELCIQLKQDDLPFDAEIIVVGSFELSGIKDAESMMKANATAILYPYVRSTLSMVTSLAGISPVVIPTINLVRMFEKEEKSVITE